MSKILFYKLADPYGVFSNFDYRHPISMNGKAWKTTEHYFQAQKFAGTPHEEAVRNTSRAADAAEMGRSRALPLRKDWEQRKDSIMKDAVKAKFTQYPHLTKILIDTGDSEIIEHTSNDNYWADGGDGTGKNMLGIILMEIRKELTNLSSKV